MTKSQTDDTLSVATIDLILFVARQQGIDSDVLAHAVGVNPDQLHDPDGRVFIR